MRYLLNSKNKILFLLLFILLNISNSILRPQTFDEDSYTETVNVRKAFFLSETEWHNYLNKVNKIDEENKVGFICNIDKDNYEILFYSAKNGWDDIYSYGRISYQFNLKKELLKVKVFFQSNNNSYIYFDKERPNNFDVYLFGNLYKKNLSYHFPFDSLKILSLNSIMTLLEKYKLDKELLIKNEDFKLKEKFIKKVITPALGIKYIDDGARNEFGKFVYIDNLKEQKTDQQGLNCSGFIKEITDNYIRLHNQDFKWLKIDTLKRRRTDERKDISYQYLDLEYDPFFGLDWIKNSIDEINKVCSYKIIKAEEYMNDEKAPYMRYQGFDVENLREIFFMDQQKDSSYFYFIAFNKLRKAEPVIPQFYHLAIIVPYFKEHHFYLKVYESSAETNFKNILKINNKSKAAVFKIPIPITYLCD